jgi:biopolymer transport protein ExbB
MKKQLRAFLAVIMLGGLLVAAMPALAQEAGAEAVQSEEAIATTTGFVDIVFRGGAVNTLIWLMIFATSAATLALIIDALITVKREKLIPDDVVEGVRESLNRGDLDAAVETCEVNPCPLSSILMIGFSNITEGYEVIQEAITSAAEIENEKLMQRVNYLNLCGQISPMLGLLGTVTGMVRAFASLAGQTGAAKAAMLAQSISTALWTTAIGLIIAVPALLAYTLIRNYATRLVLEIEATTIDLIKVLRNAEVEEE